MVQTSFQWCINLTFKISHLFIFETFSLNVWWIISWFFFIFIRTLAASINFQIRRTGRPTVWKKQLFDMSLSLLTAITTTLSLRAKWLPISFCQGDKSLGGLTLALTLHYTICVCVGGRLLCKCVALIYLLNELAHDGVFFD